MKNQGSKIPPFVPLNLRAFVEASAEEWPVIMALAAWDWMEGFKEGISQADLAVLSKVPERSLRRILPQLKGRGWVTASRKFSEPLKYSCAIPEISWKEARNLLIPRLPDYSAKVAGKGIQDGQPGLPFRPAGPIIPATVAASNIQETDFNRKTEVKEKPTPQAAKVKHPDQDAFWEKAKATFTEKYPGQKLDWPAVNWFKQRLNQRLTERGLDELARLFYNYVNTSWVTGPTLQHFISDPGRWLKVGGTNGTSTSARGFHTASAGWGENAGQ